MIELRWLEKKVIKEVIIGTGMNKTAFVSLEKFLQYRQEEEDWGGCNEEPDLVWSDWVDVPTEQT